MYNTQSFGTIRASLSPSYHELLANKGLGDEENFEPGEPAPSFLKINSVACDYLLIITLKKPTLAFWLREKCLSMTHPNEQLCQICFLGVIV